jgi:selenocysteine-specific elongation factor
MSSRILGTAGHIDHGKTALVRALTGVDTDRLPEEKARGITIDLGFANLRLGEHTFGVVDVPGHESFIRNMLAGATGMDAVVLVVAADEGVMPQTREHLAILDLLDVRSGVVAITKRDLVTEEWIQLVVDDVQATIASTSLRDAPIIPVSARTGEGMDELRQAIVQQATAPAARTDDDLFRMPIDRVFTVRGTGTVVTGTVWSGNVAVEETVDVRPAGPHARVRGIQVHGAALTSARALERAAVALSGVDTSAVQRGDVLVRGEWLDTLMLTVQARVIEGTDWPLEMRQRVRVHLGTAEVLARVVLLDAAILEPGEAGWIQLRLEEPLVARAGDRLVLRSYSPVTTIAGGVVVELSELKRRAVDAQEVERLKRIISGNAALAVPAFLEQRGRDGASVAEIAVHTPHSPRDVADALAGLHDDVVLIRNRVFSRTSAETMMDDVRAIVDRMHAEQPLRALLDRAEVRGTIRTGSGELIDHAIDTLVERGDLVTSGSGIARAGFQPTLSARQNLLRQTLLSVLTTAGLAAPPIAELAGPEDPDVVRSLLRLLEADGAVKSIGPDTFIEASALIEAEKRMRQELGGRSGLSASEFRAILPVSRKHLIPLLEYFDRTGLTRRDGDLRSVVAT